MLNGGAQPVRRFNPRLQRTLRSSHLFSKTGMLSANGCQPLTACEPTHATGLLIQKRRTPRQQCADVQPARQCAEGTAAAFEAAGDEGVGDGAVTRLEQQFGL